MKFLIFLILLIPNMINSTCSDGCLKCGKGSKCQICDLSNFYVNNAGTCVLRSAENCHLLSNKGACLRCNRGHFLDVATHKCVKLDESKKIANCDFHYNAEQCALCNKGFFLNEKSQCLPVEIQVPGCKVHAQKTCLICDDNKLLHPSKERCIEFQSQEKCASFGYLSCQQCQAGFVLNTSNFFETEDQNRFQKIELMLRDVGRREIDTQEVTVSPCQKLRDPNCLVFQDFKSCKQCKEFFFLDENKVCQIYPIPAIRNCAKYSNYNICVQCVQGYLLSSPSQCSKVKNIDFCLIYDNTQPINVCTECNPNYYVQGNLCLPRLIVVNKCLSYHKSLDLCAQCEIGFVLSTDSKKCFPQIDQCVVYENSSEVNTALVCKVCQAKHILENGTCNLGTLANCNSYTSSTVCQICENKFYWGTLPSGTTDGCHPHEEIPSCSTYSKSEKNRCDLCDNFNVLLLPINSCEQVTSLIPQCIQYLNLTQCGQCKDGYFLSSPEVCDPIPESEQCLRKTGALLPCVQCKQGYVLKSGLCQKPLDFQVSNCSLWSHSTSSEEITCNYCKTNSIFMRDLQKFGNCISQTERSTYFTKKNINNCEVYSIDQVVLPNPLGEFNNTLKCHKCFEGYKISEDQTQCLQTCPNQTLLMQRWDEKKRLFTHSICVNDPNHVNCDTLTLVNDKAVPMDNAIRTCVKCKSGFIQSDSGIKFVTVNPENLSEPTPLGVHYLGFNCQPQGAFNFHSTNTMTAPLNCVTFSFDAVANKWLCARCKQGWTGSVDPLNYKNLLCNRKVEDCDTSAYWGGFFQHNRADLADIHRHMTCHACFTRGKIPIIFVDQDKNPLPFGIEYGDQPFSQSIKKEASITQCLEESALNFRIPEDRYSPQFPRNCGAGLVLVDQNKDFRTLYKQNNWQLTLVQCIVCEPGFRPLFENGFLTKCERIDNCLNEPRNQKAKLINRWFNGCSDCAKGFSWMGTWDTVNSRFVVDFDRCVSNFNDSECLVFSDNTSNSRRCVLCKNGLFLNRDGICEKLRAPLCKEGESFIYQPNYKSSFANHNLFHEYFVLHSGCRECNEGYNPLQVLSKDYPSCFYSKYDFIGNFTTSTHYIPNCQNYRAQVVAVDLLCEKCQQGFILSTDNKACPSLESFPNCDLANLVTNRCQTCSEFYVNVDGFCEKPMIKFCKTYNQNLQHQQCQVCQDQYKLINNHCLFGHVKNCRVYNGLNCETCLEDFHLVQIKNGQFCIRKLENQNCLIPVVDTLTRTWQCTKCNEEFVPTVDPLKRKSSVCAPISLIDNCEQYHNFLVLAESTFTCLKCKPGFFLSKNQCFARTRLTENCITFSSNHDFCVQCAENFYLSNDKNCEQFPKGIPNCRVYQSINTCSQCDEHYFLDGNQCLELQIDKRISKCMFYSSPLVCTQCQLGNYLSNNLCFKARASNCLTYVNLNQCKTCLPDHGLYKDHQTGMVHCIYISTQNCQVAEEHYPFDCKKCSKLYYLDKGKCFANQTFIQNCEDYLDAKTCRKCENDFILSHDQKSCLSFAQMEFQPIENCIDNQEKRNPVCQACQPGFHLYKGNCVECKDKTVDKGCMSCNGVDQDKEECSICAVGWFMNEEGTCLKNTGNVTTVELPLGTIVSPTQNPNTVTPSPGTVTPSPGTGTPSPGTGTPSPGTVTPSNNPTN